VRKSYSTRRRHYKIIKSSVSELGLAADRFSNRAEAIENRSSNLNAFAAIAAEYGITPSHSVSCTTVRTTNELQVTAEQTHLLSRLISLYSPLSSTKTAFALR